MNIKKYAFRLTITTIAFVLGFSAYRCLGKVEQFSMSTWFGVVKRLLPFHSKDPRIDNSAAGCGGAAACKFSGEYYLSEDRFPSGFSDFGHLELLETSGNAKTQIAPTGTVYADREYRISTIATDADLLEFGTDVKGGVSYRFTGRVRHTDEQVGSFHESRIGDIGGKLEKLQNGTVIATLQTTFYLFGR
ncbi:MAG: hypothetical protein ABJB40_00715 [Acidobacteriota bacterium]